jgi:hypothetical protein
LIPAGGNVKTKQVMTHVQVQRKLEHALAFAHAALDETTLSRVAQAKVYAAEVLPVIAGLQPTALALGEARHLYERVKQLRAVLRALDRKWDQRVDLDGN